MSEHGFPKLLQLQISYSCSNYVKYNVITFFLLNKIYIKLKLEDSFLGCDSMQSGKEVLITF